IVSEPDPDIDSEDLYSSLNNDFPTVLKYCGWVYITGMNRRAAGRARKAIGYSTYLTTPFKRSQIHDVLSEVFGTKRGTSSSKRAIIPDTCPFPLAKILLVEDNIINQKVAVSMLHKMGYRVDCVANGREAVDAVGNIRYDLILMDCQMPEMDGYEASRKIRKYETMKTDCVIKIIAMTANAMSGDRERCIDSGMDDYISKPVQINDLSAVICKWLSISESDKRGHDFS
ncbi:MAG: response regulator, partial [Planctomycetes bacterium]|nr:response regulator [Planctomycetota bacterium]